MLKSNIEYNFQWVTMSYDKSKNFKGSQKAKIKDEFNFSPAQNDMYNYKKCISKEFHIGGVDTMKEPAYGQYASKSMKKMARYEQDDAEMNPSY